MITKIKRLKSIGKFYDFAAKGDGLDWHKNTFIFAPNAYGKSTLVNVLRSVCEDGLTRGSSSRRLVGASGTVEVGRNSKIRGEWELIKF